VATTKKKTPAKSTHKQAATVQHRSFRVSKQATPFFHFDFTIQTVYWLILSAIVISLALWVMSLNMRVQAIYDQIDQNNSQTVTLPRN
jgi:hypothetical protein